MYSQHALSNTRSNHAHRLAVLLKHNIFNSILTFSTWLVLGCLSEILDCPILSKVLPRRNFALLYVPYYQAFICRIPLCIIFTPSYSIQLCLAFSPPGDIRCNYPLPF